MGFVMCADLEPSLNDLVLMSSFLVLSEWHIAWVKNTTQLRSGLESLECWRNSKSYKAYRSKMAMQRWVSSNQGEKIHSERWQKNKSVHVNSGDIR